MRRRRRRTHLDEQLAYGPMEFAQRLGVGRTTVYTMLSNGDLRSLKVGRRRLIPASELQRLLKAAR